MIKAPRQASDSLSGTGDVAATSLLPLVRTWQMFRGLLLATLALHPTLADAQTPRLRVTELARVDGTREDLVPIQAAVVLRGGRVAISQQQDGRVLIFDSLGKRAGTVGRSGAGPGEFRTMRNMGRIGDSLWIYDDATRRITLIAPEVRVARTVPVPQLRAPAPQGGAAQPLSVMRILGVRANGIAVLASGPGTPPRGLPPNAGMIAMIDRAGVVERFTGVVPSSDHMVFVPGTCDGCGVSLTIPFFAHVQSAASTDGAYFGTVVSSLQASPPSVRVTVIRADRGDTAYSVTVGVTPQAIPANVRDSALRATLARARNAELAAAFRAQGSVPTVYPLVVSLTVGEDGAAWLRLRTRDGGSPHVVLRPSGVVRGEVMLPRDYRVVAVSGDTFWALHSDSDGIHSVVRFRVAPQ